MTLVKDEPAPSQGRMLLRKRSASDVIYAVAWLKMRCCLSDQ